MGRAALCCWVRGKPCRDFGLGVLCKPRISLMTVTVWHYILQWHQGSSKLKFLLKNHLCMDSLYREGMRALTNLLFKWKGVKFLPSAAFWKKPNFVNQPPPETMFLLSPQTVIAFCSSETLFLVHFCSWRGQSLALNKKEDLKHPLNSCWYFCHHGI